MSALTERAITSIIYNKLLDRLKKLDKGLDVSGSPGPLAFLLDVSSSPALKPLSNTIEESAQKLRDKEFHEVKDMFHSIKTAFDTYITENPSDIDRDFTLITQRFPIDNLVKPSSCNWRTGLGIFWQAADRLYIIILFLVVLLFMKHKGIPEKEFFKKTTFFGSVSLLDHLEKKESEWLFKKKHQPENCSDLFTELINVYNFVYSNTDEPKSPGLTLLNPIGGRRSRYRKSKRKARKTRRS